MQIFKKVFTVSQKKLKKKKKDKLRNKGKKPKRIKLSDRGLDYPVNSNPKVPPVPCKHP